MDLKLFTTVFATIFLAEIGDKTQLATLPFAADVRHDALSVFLGAALALAATSALGVFAGAALAHWLNPRYLSWASGAAFILIGVWTLARA